MDCIITNQTIWWACGCYLLYRFLSPSAEALGLLLVEYIKRRRAK